MRKQALVFFTMFSLILMLSIYYVTLPQDAKVDKEEVSVVKEIDESKNKTKDAQKKKNNEIISDPNISTDEKNQAIKENEEIDEKDKLEKEYAQSIQALGYENTVEIKDKTIYITILNQNQDDEIASTIMKNIYAKVNSAFFIEVSFNSK